MPLPEPSLARAAVPLCADLLACGLEVRVRVSGKSMAPLLGDGDMVVLRSAEAAALRPGDLVLYRGAAGTGVLHRMISRRKSPGGGLRLTTKGDALVLPDEEFGGEQVIGRVVAVVRSSPDGEREMSLDTPLARFRGRVRALASLLPPRLRRWAGIGLR